MRGRSDAPSILLHIHPSDSPRTARGIDRPRGGACTCAWWPVPHAGRALVRGVRRAMWGGAVEGGGSLDARGSRRARASWLASWLGLGTPRVACPVACPVAYPSGASSVVGQGIMIMILDLSYVLCVSISGSELPLALRHTVPMAIR